ncbi:MAG: hypothetical protein QM758_20510 [Armatimonas sp.]
MKFENTELPRAGRQWSMSLGVFLAILAILAVAGWQGFAAIGEFLRVASKPRPAPKTVPVIVKDREK